MKRILIIISIIVLTLSAQAQRRLPGQQGFQATIGKVDGFSSNSIHAGAAFSQFTKNSHRWTFGAEYLCKKLEYSDYLVPVEQFTAEGGYYRTLISDGSKTFFFTAGISGMTGYELVNRDTPLLFDGSTILSKSKFLFGGVFSVEIEAYTIDQIILLAGFRQRVLPTSTVNTFHCQFYLGIKFIIN